MPKRNMHRKIESEPRQCPACELVMLRMPMAQNAYSRFVNVYICSPCGVKEALEGGFFWRESAEARALDIKADFR